MKNQTFIILVAAAIAILSSTFVAADVIRVLQDQATIQAGINASVNGKSPGRLPRAALHFTHWLLTTQYMLPRVRTVYHLPPNLLELMIK